MNKPLAKYTTHELLRELERREDRRIQGRVPQFWCTDCVHFKVWNSNGEPPKDHNCCGKSHTMKFRMGEDPNGLDTGFYRHACRDFVAVVEPVRDEPRPQVDRITEAALRARREREMGMGDGKHTGPVK